MLFGIRSPVDAAGGEGLLYRIDKATGMATFVANTNTHFATIAFAPNGTLYESAADLGTSGPTDSTIRTINPSNGAILTSAPTDFPSGRSPFATTARSSGARETGMRSSRSIPRRGRSRMSATRARTSSAAWRSGRPSSPPARAFRTTKTLCLNNNRFAVTTAYRTNDGRSGGAIGTELTADSGYFYFFNAANIEIVVKVLSGCFGGSPAYWVFAAGLTNVEVTLRVTDTHTGSVKTYVNALGNAFAPVQDTSAFATCP